MGSEVARVWARKVRVCEDTGAELCEVVLQRRYSIHHSISAGGKRSRT